MKHIWPCLDPDRLLVSLRGICRIGCILLVSGLVVGCSRPTGDFGRTAPNVSHDQLAPALGKALAHRREEPVSLFGRTDDEITLENLSWTILRPVHSADWVSGSLIEGRRTRVFPDINGKLDFRAYLFWLRIERFTSSEARWNRVIDDIRADQGAITPFYEQARLVYTVDQQRIAYLEQNPDIGPRYQKNTRARLLENEALIQLALDGLNFRYAAYDYAIKRLTVEFPSPRAIHAAEELARYAQLIERGGERGLPFIENPELLSSRITHEDDKKKPDGKKDGDETVRK
ncbi:MAG: hypothetical protein H2045_12810 [Rhizobiales bacterium]|nr:hypothetical protein [Hyphomicrobiales bacterium]